MVGALIACTSCESKLNDRHENNDAFTSTKIEYLFANGTKKTIENDYADMYSHSFRFSGMLTQITAAKEGKNRANVYDVKNDKSRWQNYYVDRMSTLSEVEKINNTLSEEKQNEYRPYLEATKILKAHNTAMATDFFGSMPYTEAFTARNSLYGGEVIFRPKYDTQKDIYYAIIKDLEEAAIYFKTAELDGRTEVQLAFPLQDIIYGGDLKKWYKFANSLRLRYAMRISNVDEAKAKEVLSSLKLEDLITDNSDNAAINVSGEAFAENAMWRAMNESHNKNNGYFNFAPEFMTNILKEANDPRVQVLFQPASDDEGVVLDSTKVEIIGYPASADEAIELIKKDAEMPENYIQETYAVYNATTFRKNYQLPIGVGITASEVYLFLAEAQHRGLIQIGTTEDLYNKGVMKSIQYYYDYYFTSDAKIKDQLIMKTDVTDETLSSWLATSTFKFDSSKAIEMIATQKWIQTGIMQPFENWSEYKRYDYPTLPDDKENGVLLNKSNAPVRFIYPSTEASMNTENYNSVADQNNKDAKVWWDVK